MKVRIERDTLGFLSVSPVDTLDTKAIREYLTTWNVDSEGSALVQSHIVDTMQGIGLAPMEIEEVLDGYIVIADLNTWNVLHLYGWDTHILAENGTLH